MRPIYLFILIWALGACAQAKAECAAIPAEVEQYLRSQPGWAVVDMKDLVKDDQALWERNHSGLCPGIAAVDLDGTGTNAYAVALLNSANGQETERVVVLRRQAGRVTQEPLVSPTNVRFANVASPLVVWRAGPGTYRDRTSGQIIAVAHDGIVYEKMEAIATLYYHSNGKFSLVQTSN